MFILLPKTVLKVIIGDWLDLKAVVRVDSAFCVHAFRTDLLNTLASQTFACLDLRTFTGISWVLLRGIKAAKVLLEGNLTFREEALVSAFLSVSAPRLRCIHATGSYSSDATYYFAPICRDLTEFVSGALWVPQLVRVLENNPRLRTVSVEIRWDLTASFESVSLPSLTSLSIKVNSECDRTVVGAIVARTQSLQKLSVEHCTHIPFQAIFTKKCADLRSLRLMKIDHIRDHLPRIAKRCSNVVNLCFEGCVRLCDCDVLFLLQHLPHLRALNLTWCNVSDASVQHLATHCAHRLQMLQLGRHRAVISRAAVTQLRQRCTVLHTFRFVETFLQNNLRVMRDGIATVLVALFYLTDERIRTSVVWSDSVEIVDISNTWVNCAAYDGLSTHGMAELCDKWPSLHTVVVSQAMLASVREMVKSLPESSKLTVTSDVSVYAFDLMNLPI